MARSSNPFTPHRQILTAYRAGEASWPEVADAVRVPIEKLAVWFASRYRYRGNRLLRRDDLIQEAGIALWRALDEYDPTRGTTIDAHCYWKVGNWLEKRLAKALGWPRKDRTPVASWDTGSVDVYELVGETHAVQETEAMVAEVDRAVGCSFSSAVLRLVLDGVNRNEVAAEAFAMPELRLSRRWETEDDARRDVRASYERARERAGALTV